MFSVHLFLLGRIIMWHAFLLSWCNGIFEVLVKSQWEVDGFSTQRTTVFHCHFCFLISFAFWWNNLNSAISELWLVSCAVLCFCSIRCYSSVTSPRVYFSKVFSVSPTSSTVSVTYRSYAYQFPCTQCTQHFKPVLPWVLGISSVPSEVPSGPLQGCPLPCQSPWLLHISGSPDVVLYFLLLTFQRSNVFLCFPNRNVYYDVWVCFSNSRRPTLRITTAIASPLPTHAPCASQLLLTSSAICRFPTSIFSMLYSLHIYHIYL